MRRRLGPWLVALLFVSGCGDVHPASEGLTGDEALLVAAAADLRPAFGEIGVMFTAATGHEVIFDFGSSGQLAQRIIEGAPVDVYASASSSFVDQVLASGVGDRDTKATYALGRITIWSTGGAWGGWTDLADLVADPDVVFLAIANPEHAPYGLAAKEALTSAGLWDPVGSRLVFGENISDTQRLADTGDADAAIVALSLAIAAGDRGEWVLVDESLHRPLDQALVVVTDDPDRVEAATAFASFVNEPAGRDVMARFGFVLPGEGAS
ncbi:MAG: molybdate ABC transporter substrate-binding protein [Acidimicrobiia bacterium]